MRQTFWIFCGGDHGSVVLAREIVVAVREVDRRMLRVHVAVEVGEVGLTVKTFSVLNVNGKKLQRKPLCIRSLEWVIWPNG